MRIIRNFIKKHFRGLSDNSQKGFTYIELIMVMAILGTMAAVVTTSSQEYTGDHGKKVALAVEKRIIATAVTAHLKDGRSLPVTDYDLYREKYITSKSTLADYYIDTDGTIIQNPR